MQLTQSPKFNKNYAAKIIEIKEFSKHPNPKCERLKCCIVDGYSITVSIDTAPGTYIYFPVECAINELFLSVNNLFRDKTRNYNKEEGGFFEDNCRVKIVKLQGNPSEGFIMPLNSIYNWLDALGKNNEIVKIPMETEFDSVGEEILCKKYIPNITRPSERSNQGNNTNRKPKGTDRVIEQQFRFHYNTTLIKKCPYVIHPDDIISITSKVHGTSGISAWVLCAIQPSKSVRFVTWLSNHTIYPICKMFGGGGRSSNQTEIYDYLWSSRSVIKNQYYNSGVTEGFYGCDVWKYADDVIRPHLAKGMTAYYEIIGFLPTGGYIQKGFDYGFLPPVGDEKYTYGKHFGVQIYRVTYTNPDGKVFEFSAKQVQQWCARQGLRAVEEYYYGYAKDVYPDLDMNSHWSENFIAKLAVDKQFFMECNSPTCDNKVPHEGIVIKIENSLSEAYKLKCIKFLEKESKSLDNGEQNIEDNA